MANLFQQVQFLKPRTSKFDLSHDIKMSFKMGQLIPTCVMETIPGDVFEISVENMMRFAPLIAPVMHKVDIQTHYFFVPNRILWENWEKFITDSEDVMHPAIPVGTGITATVAQGSLADYLGVPTGEYEAGLNISPFPFAAYLKIYDEYYRDQNLETEQFVPLVDGTGNNDYENWLLTTPLRAAWKHDYLTSALPFAQKGDAVQIPLTFDENIPVDFEANAGNPIIVNPVTGAPIPGADLTSANVTGELLADAAAAAIDPDGTLTVDVQAQATDINTLRTAWKIQSWLERQARGGSRYVEQLLSHFGVRSSDKRLQRPEYIGGSFQNMVISEVLATAENTDAEVAVGQMAGHGISVGGGNKFKFRCEEHGFIMGLVVVRPRTAYQDGLHRSWVRFDKFDYAWPTFADLGEQEIKQLEVRARVEAGTDPQRTFGYQSRYAEYKFMNSRVAGEMRSSLDYWHLGRKFETTADPELTASFIRCNPSTRIFAVTSSDVDHIYAHIWNNITAIRKLPRFGIPATI